MKHPDWSKSANIYEVNIRQYTPEGTINAFRGNLPRLHDMDVDILWIMPVQPIGILNRKGSLGSYYSIKDYTAVNREFGTMYDFMALVNEAHNLGMHVLLDWVANHTSWDHVWTDNHPDFYKIDEKDNFISPWDWSDVIALNYDNPEMRRNMIDAMKFWVKETDIDGFRCDMAGLVPVDFWYEARKELETIKPMFMLAEDEENIDLLRNAFDMNFTWEMHHLMNDIARGNKKAIEIWWKLAQYNEKYPPDAYRMYFTSNHDENSHSGSALERMGEAAKAFALLTYVLQGMPLIYSGQEAGNNKRLRFFDKDSIDWSKLSMADFYKTLNQLKKNNQSLWNGSFGGPLIPISKERNENIFAFERHKDDNQVMVFLNLSNTNQQFNIDKEMFSSDFTDVFSGKKMNISVGYRFDLKPWGYFVLSNSN
jgi:glycosidase